MTASSKSTVSVTSSSWRPFSHPSWHPSSRPSSWQPLGTPPIVVPASARWDGRTARRKRCENKSWNLARSDFAPRRPIVPLGARPSCPRPPRRRLAPRIATLVSSLCHSSPSSPMPAKLNAIITVAIFLATGIRFASRPQGRDPCADPCRRARSSALPAFSRRFRVVTYICHPRRGDARSGDDARV